MVTSGDNRRDRHASIAQKLTAVAAALAEDVRDERLRRGLTTHEIADLAGVCRAAVSNVEAGRVASLETYVRLATALRLRTEFGLVDARRQSARSEDPVHAAMGEIEVTQLARPGREARVDEPFQHYQFAGRGDVVVWDAAAKAFLHIENRTRFPNLQEAFGAFNAKRAYLAQTIGEREGIRRWASETHVMVVLWSAEALHALRLHRGSFRAVCDDRPDGWEAWWVGETPPPGRHSTLVVFDPLEGRRRDRRRWVGLDEAAQPGLKARYRDYADALEALRQAGRA